jgi:hypothetical protein
MAVDLEELRMMAGEISEAGHSDGAKLIRDAIAELSANREAAIGGNDGVAYLRLRTALRKIAELRFSEAGEPFDEALDIADAALAVGVNVGVSAPQAEPAA